MTTSSRTEPHAPRNLWRWFDPRGRAVGTWAFVLNRLSAIGLTVYLFMHLVVLGTLARGPEAYGAFLALIKNPFFVAGELLVVVAGLYHGLNGLRIGLNSFGVAVPAQKTLFYILFAIAAVLSVVFAVRMFTA